MEPLRIALDRGLLSTRGVDRHAAGSKGTIRPESASWRDSGSNGQHAYRFYGDFRVRAWLEPDHAGEMAKPGALNTAQIAVLAMLEPGGLLTVAQLSTNTQLTLWRTRDAVTKLSARGLIVNPRGPNSHIPARWSITDRGLCTEWKPQGRTAPHGMPKPW
jgi:DNA-binding MarR family transcriptional regulator